jgi:hypothetical protein
MWKILLETFKAGSKAVGRPVKDPGVKIAVAHEGCKQK